MYELAFLIVWLARSLGFLLGESFSELDHKVKHLSPRYQAMSEFSKYIISCLLDFTHHFQYGLALMIIGHYLQGDVQTFVYNFGWGLVISDWKDYKNVLKRFGVKVDEEIPE